MITANLQQLYKFMALFDSQNEGERYAALAAANRFLQSRSLTWRDLVVANTAPPPPPRAEARPDYGPVEECDCEDCARAAAEIAIEHPEYETLAERHQEFLESISTKWRDRELTEKQRAYIFGLAERLGIPRAMRTGA